MGAIADRRVHDGRGLRLTSRDFARLAVLVLHEGCWGEALILQGSWFQAATSAHVQPNPEQAYGYQFWRRSWSTPCGPKDAAYMWGNGGNALLVMPELDAVVQVTRQHYGQRGIHQQTIRLVEDYVLRTVRCEEK
jgi:CubicO group peptidase (beta-lactamase class C family)